MKTVKVNLSKMLTEIVEKLFNTYKLIQILILPSPYYQLC